MPKDKTIDCMIQYNNNNNRHIHSLYLVLNQKQRVVFSLDVRWPTRRGQTLRGSTTNPPPPPSYNNLHPPSMTSPAFATFFEIFANGVVLTVALITTVTFAERCVKRSAPLNLSGLGASLVSVFYSVYGESLT